jgi:hypothetical protein
MKRTIACLAIALYVPLASAAYRCVDERGRTLVGDTPPAGCANVPMYEIGRTGKVLRRIEPTPTPEQLKALKEEQERRKEEQKAAAEQKRQDLALLASYGSPKEFDVARDRNIEPVTGRIAAAEQRMKELDARKKDLSTQMEFYNTGKSKRANAKLVDPSDDQTGAWFRAEVDRMGKERAALAESVRRLHKEIAELKAKYESDKARWMLLKSGKLAVGALSAPAAPPPAAAPASAPPAAIPAKGGKPGY